MAKRTGFNGKPELVDESQPEEEADVTPGWSDWEGFLEGLGIFGFKELERPILCSLITGDPVLLIGAHGTAKTALTGVLSSTLGLNFHAYDASKAMFEDMVGFPNPEALGRGELDYVPTEISLWDKEFILADEISRASAQTQSKWLEIIRSRKIMGQSLDQLKYIFAAMNPPGTYDGANPLDPALAGRFAWILKVPESADMEHDERVKVTQAVGGDDAPAAQDVFDRTIESDVEIQVLNSLDQFRGRLEAIRARWSEDVSRYVSRLSESVFTSSQKESRNLDGRRVGILRRNLLTALALEENPTPTPDVFEDVVIKSLPHLALGEEIPEHLYQMAHREAYRSVFEGATSTGTRETKDLLDSALDEETFEEVVTPLALIAREFYRVTDDPSADPADLDLIRRIMDTGHQALIKDWQFVRSMDDHLAELWAHESGTADLAQIVVSWWSAEKDKRPRDTTEEFVETVASVRDKLETVLEGQT
ncbi:MAG: AAA family ATPase [bacterium]